MRVIAGKVKGFNLKMVPGDVTRPIMDRVKENLFNILTPYIVDTNFLDLFAGTGSVGIEALSRGARFARFIDLNSTAVKTILANLDHTGLTEEAEVWRMDAFDFLKREPDHQFDFIYVAPPQYEEIWIRALQMIDENTGWLFEHSTVIAQIDPVEYQDVELRNLTLFDRREYGSTELLFYGFPISTTNSPSSS